MKARRLFIALLLVMMMTVWTVSASLADDPVKILIYHAMPEVTEFLENFAAEFNKNNPDIIVEIETQKDSSTLQVKYAAGEDPDILIGSIVSQQYMDQGKYKDLSGYTKWTDRMDKDLLSSVVDVKTGNLYRLPMCKNNAGFIYNKQIFEKLGLKEAQTWDELLENLRTIKKEMPDVIPWYVFGGNYGHQSYFFVHGMRQMDIGAFETQKAISYNNSEVLAFDADGSYVEVWAEKLLQLQEEGLIDSEEAITGTAATAYEAFATGKAAIVTSGTWWTGALVKQFPETKEFLDIGPFPSIIDGREPYTTASQDSSVAISASSPYQEQIERVLDAMFTVENLTAYSESRGAPSSFTDVTSDWSCLSEKVYANQKTYPNVVQVSLPNGFGLSDVDKLGQELMVGMYTPKEFAAEYTNRWNACFTD